MAFIAPVFTLLVLALSWYFALPALNLRSPEFWGVLLFAGALMGAVSLLINSVKVEREGRKNTSYIQFGKPPAKGRFVLPKGDALRMEMLIGFGCAGLSAAVLLLGLLSGAAIFHAADYAGLINKVTTIQERTLDDFRSDFEQTDYIGHVALMDTPTAQVIGARQMGQLSQYVSQYTTSGAYTTITVNGAPKKVTDLSYAGLFQWLNSRAQGAPGYISVDPVQQTAAYVPVEQGLRYTTSAYLNDNLLRRVRMAWPTVLLGENYGWLELNEEGEPWYVVPTYRATIGLFGGRVVSGAILVDPASGAMTRYDDPAAIPEWVDRVYDGDHLSDLYNYYGYYRNGYFNFSNAGRVQTTDDYGYLTIGNDIWVFTGVTSVVNTGGDESNIGFVLMNQRTAECIYYTIPGAEEHTAMHAAEGQVANYGYQASFPSLVNIAGEPTYVMVLRDDSYVVKGYALVNMSQYSLVGVGTSQAAVIESYRAALAGQVSSGFGLGSGAASGAQQGPDSAAQPAYTPSGETETVTVQVTRVEYAVVGGNTYAYLLAANGQLYRVAVDGNEAVLFLEPGAVTLTAERAAAPVKNAALAG